MRTHICSNIYVHPYMRKHILTHMHAHIRIQLGTLISRAMGWDIDHVLDNLVVRLYCSARLVHPSGAADSRTYWATDSKYPHTKNGARRDMIEVALNNNSRGMTQLVSFISMENLPDTSPVARTSCTYSVDESVVTCIKSKR